MLLFFFSSLCQCKFIYYQSEQESSQCQDFTETWAFYCWGADGGSTFSEAGDGYDSNPEYHGKGAFIYLELRFNKKVRLCFKAGETPHTISPVENDGNKRYLKGGFEYGGNGGTYPSSHPSFAAAGGGGGYTGITIQEEEEGHETELIVVGSGGGGILGQRGAPGGIDDCLSYSFDRKNEIVPIQCEDTKQGGTGEAHGTKMSQAGGGGGAGFKGGPGGSHPKDQEDYNSFLRGCGGKSLLNEELMKQHQIDILTVSKFDGHKIPDQPFYHKDIPNLFHGAFKMVKLINCTQDQVPTDCETEDCACSPCFDHCISCSTTECFECEPSYKKDEERPDRCYVDSASFSESFDFTVSEDFSNSFNFTATDVFSPTRSERVIIVPESNSETKYIAIGCSVGGVVVIAAVVVLSIVFCRRKKLPFTSNANEDSMRETVIPMQEDQLTVDDSSDSSMLSQHADDPFLPVNQQNQILAE